MCDRDVVDVVFPHLAAVEVVGVERRGGGVRVVARSRGDPVACPVCGTVTGKVHGYYRRYLADAPVGGRPVVIELTLRRLVCPSLECSRQTFHQQVPGLAERYARRTAVLHAVVRAVALAGRAGAGVLAVLGVLLSRTGVLNALMALPEPQHQTPGVIGVDDCALTRTRRYASVVIDAITHRCLDVLPDRLGTTFAQWLRDHPGVTVVCRDRCTADAPRSPRRGPGGAAGG